MRGAQKLHEMTQNVFLYQVGNVISGAGSDVGKAPGSLELELRDLMMKKLQEDWNQVCIDYGLDRRILLN